MTNKKNKNILPIIMVVFIALLIAYIAVDKYVLDKYDVDDIQKQEVVEADEVSRDKTDDNELEEIRTVISGGKIEKVTGIEIKELQVVSLGNVTDVGDDGSFSATIYDKTVTPVAAMLPDKEFGLMILAEPDQKELLMNVQTTAETLVFMSPFLISSEPELAMEIKNVIKDNKAVKEFAQVIESVLQKDVEPLDDEEYITAFGKAIESVLLSLNE